MTNAKDPHDQDFQMTPTQLCVKQTLQWMQESGLTTEAQDKMLITMASDILGVDFKAIVNRRNEAVLMSYMSPGTTKTNSSKDAVLVISDETGKTEDIRIPVKEMQTRRGLKIFRVCPPGIEPKEPVESHRGHKKLLSIDALAKMLQNSALVKGMYVLDGKHISSLLRACQISFSFAEEQGETSIVLRGYYRPGSRAKGEYVATGEKLYGKDGRVYFKDILYTDAIYQQIYAKAKEIANDGSLAGNNPCLRIFSAIGKKRREVTRGKSTNGQQASAA